MGLDSLPWVPPTPTHELLGGSVSKRKGMDSGCQGVRPLSRLSLACCLGGWVRAQEVPQTLVTVSQASLRARRQEALGPRELNSADRAQQRLTAIPLPSNLTLTHRRGAPSPGATHRAGPAGGGRLLSWLLCEAAGLVSEDSWKRRANYPRALTRGCQAHLRSPPCPTTTCSLEKEAP